MMLALLITIEVIAFLFLALGLVPFKPTHSAGNLPLANKVLFILVAMILFFVLAVSSVSVEHTNCYINETIDDNGKEINTSTCEQHTIEDVGLSYLNWGMGVVSLLLGFIIILMGWMGRNDSMMNDSEE